MKTDNQHNIARLRDKAHYLCGIPYDHAQELARYYYCHELTSEFLRMILANDLVGAVRHVGEMLDQTNLGDRGCHLLPQYVEFLVSHLPAGSWGSYRTVAQWLSLKV
jgi:hypothetical protein